MGRPHEGFRGGNAPCGACGAVAEKGLMGGALRDEEAVHGPGRIAQEGGEGPLARGMGVARRGPEAEREGLGHVGGGFGDRGGTGICVARRDWQEV